MPQSGIYSPIQQQNIPSNNNHRGIQSQNKNRSGVQNPQSKSSSQEKKNANIKNRVNDKQ